MKYVNCIQVHPQVQSHYIDTFDPVSDSADLELIRTFLLSLFNGKKTFFIFNSKSKDNLLHQLKTDHLIQKDNLFLAQVNFDKDLANFILKNWMEIEPLMIFEPVQSLDWESLISYHIEVSEEEIVKMIVFHFSDIIFTRGAGGESLNVYCKNGNSLNQIDVFKKK